MRETWFPCTNVRLRTVQDRDDGTRTCVLPNPVAKLTAKATGLGKDPVVLLGYTRVSKAEDQDASLLRFWTESTMTPRRLSMSILETATSGLIVAVGSAALTWVIGGAIARKYAISQKIKESDIALSKEFYQLYGEYFQLWKRWNATLKLKHDEHGSSEFEDKRWAVFARACEVEGRFEAVIVKLCAERNLTTEQVATLGCFRQSYQQLREQINSNEPLNWYWSSHEEYMVFKRGALSVGQIVFGGKHLSDLSSLSAIRSLSSLSAITSNEWEKQWIGPSQKAYKLAKQLLSRPDSEKVEAVTQK